MNFLRFKTFSLPRSFPLPIYQPIASSLFATSSWVRFNFFPPFLEKGFSPSVACCTISSPLPPANVPCLMLFLVTHFHLSLESVPQEDLSFPQIVPPQRPETLSPTQPPSLFAGVADLCLFPFFFTDCFQKSNHPEFLLLFIRWLPLSLNRHHSIGPLQNPCSYSSSFQAPFSSPVLIRGSNIPPFP